MHYLKKQSINSNLSRFSEQWMSITYKIIAPLILPWPSPRRQLLGMIEAISPRKSLANSRSLKQALRLLQKGSAQVFTLLAPTFFAFRKGQDPQQESLEGEEETTSLGTWAGSKHTGFTPNTNVNALNIASTAYKDLIHITCFNCGKKGHYATKFSEPKKNWDSSKN